MIIRGQMEFKVNGKTRPIITAVNKTNISIICAKSFRRVLAASWKILHYRRSLPVSLQLPMSKVVVVATKPPSHISEGLPTFVYQTFYRFTKEKSMYAMVVYHLYLIKFRRVERSQLTMIALGRVSRTDKKEL